MVESTAKRYGMSPIKALFCRWSFPKLATPDMNSLFLLGHISSVGISHHPVFGPRTAQPGLARCRPCLAGQGLAGQGLAGLPGQLVEVEPGGLLAGDRPQGQEAP